MKRLIRFSRMKIRILFHPFTSRKSLYVWHKIQEVSTAGMFGVMADTTSHVSDNDQLAFR